VAVARSSHQHMQQRRSGVAAAEVFHLLARGRSGAARGRSEPPVAVSGLPLCELQMLVNHGWPNVEKIVTYIRCKLKCIHNRINST
jgi:hypothetical protein